MLYCYIIYIKTGNIYKNISGDVETRFDTLNQKLDRSFSKRKILN